MFGRHRKPRPITEPIALDHQSAPLAGLGKSGPVTPIDDWDVRFPIDPVTVLPTDLGVYIDRIDAWIQTHADAGTLDGTTPDLLDRLIAARARVWHEAIDRAVADGLQIHDRINAQGIQHLTHYGLDIHQLRGDLADAVQDHQHAHAILTGSTPPGPESIDPSPELPDPQTLPQPITHLDQEKAS